MKYSTNRHNQFFHSKEGGYLLKNYVSGNEIELDEMGKLFYTALTPTPSSYNKILKKIITKFNFNIDKWVLNCDLKDFLEALIELGFINTIRNDLLKLQLNLTERCNVNCIHCYIPENKRRFGDSLSFKHIQESIDYLISSGGKELVLSGGEVFLHPMLKSIIIYAASKGCNITILSNLSLLTERIINLLIDYNISVQTSLYSVDPVVHDMITGIQGSCNKTIKAIKKLNDNGINLSISCVVMTTNKDKFIGVLELGKKLGIDVQCNCALSMDLDFNDKNKFNRLSEEDSRNFFITLCDYHQKNGNFSFSLKTHDISALSEDSEWFSNQLACESIQTSCAINGNGDVIPCASFGHVLGNINDDTLENILNYAKNKGNSLTLLNKGMGKCMTCLYYEYCHICPASKYNEGKGDFSSIDEYNCRIAKIASEVDKKFTINI